MLSERRMMLNYIMKVIEKETEMIIEVYGIEQDSCGYPKFLIYSNNQWMWRSAKHYAPIQF